MSVRAYRINKIETKETPSLNLWHDKEIMDFINNFDGEDMPIIEQLSDGGSGTIELSVEVLKALVKDFDFKDRQEQKKELQDDIDFAEKMGDNFILYNCF